MGAHIPIGPKNIIDKSTTKRQPEMNADNCDLF